jgi:hypothetical protein
MAVSGTSSFSANRNEIIDQAAKLLNAIGTGVTMGAAMRNDFAFALNAMVKRWQAKGIHVWTTTEATLFPQAGQYRYSAGSGATDHITEVYYETSASADLIAGQTALNITDTSNITIGDFLGVVMDNGALHWGTVTAKSSTSVTINGAGLTDSAATGNAVFNYTSKIVKPLAVVDARRYDIDGATDTPLIMISRQEYRALPVKTESGTMNEVFYDPQRSTGYIQIWRVPETVSELLKFTWHRPIMDFTAPTDDADLPQEWIQTLQYNLALVMMPMYPVPQQKERMITAMAAQFFDDLSGFDRENESIFIQPDLEG